MSDSREMPAFELGGPIQFEDINADLQIARAVLPVEFTQAVVAGLDSVDESRWQTSTQVGARDVALYGAEALERGVNGKVRTAQTGHEQPDLTAVGALITVLRPLGRKFFSINRQLARGVQTLHVDDKQEMPVYVAQLSDGGTFDYFEDDADYWSGAEPEPLPVGAGDLVKLKSAFIHRGNNPSGHTRYNVVLFNFRKRFL